MDLEVQQHLWDCLFYGVGKHINNSIWYLYSIPGVMYLHLIVSTHKAESTNEETWDRVKAKATVITELVEGEATLKQQIAKLMAALTQGGQASGNTSALNSPWGQWCGLGMVEEVKTVNQTLKMGEVALAKGHTLQPSIIRHQRGCGGHGNGQDNQGVGWDRGPSVRRENAACHRDLLSPVLQMSGMEPYSLRVPHPKVSFKPTQGDLRNVAYPLPSDSH